MKKQSTLVSVQLLKSYICDVNTFLIADEGLHLFQGDILLTPAQQHALQASKSNQKAVVRDEFALWSNARVPYVLDGSLSECVFCNDIFFASYLKYDFNIVCCFPGSSARSAINTAIGEYHARTCIRFVPRRNEANYVRFFSGRG